MSMGGSDPGTTETQTEKREGGRNGDRPSPGPEARTRPREVTSTCPDCGRVLVRPADFSAERLFYLHRKWGACLPPGGGSDAGGGGSGPLTGPGARSAAG